MKETASKMLATLLTACAVLLLTAGICFADVSDEKAFEIAWNNMTEEQKYNASMELQAWSVGLDESSFKLFADVVEAESDRAHFEEGETTEGRIYVASCIWSRVFSSSFPNTVYGVLTASGQFTTVSGGVCYTNCTKASRWAVIKGLEELLDGTIPNNMYWFNCISYFQGFNAYMKVGDNYFSTTGAPTYFENGVLVKDGDGNSMVRNIHKMTIVEELEYLKLKKDTETSDGHGE